MIWTMALLEVHSTKKIIYQQCNTYYVLIFVRHMNVHLWGKQHDVKNAIKHDDVLCQDIISHDIDRVCLE